MQTSPPLPPSMGPSSEVEAGWSGKRDSNPRPRAWKARALPLSYSRLDNTETMVTSSPTTSLWGGPIPGTPWQHYIDNDEDRSWWGEEDSNLRRRTPADLQSAPVGRLGISPHPPSGLSRERRHSRTFAHRARTSRLIPWSWRRDLNPRPADYKSAALPTELRQHQTFIL